MRLRFVRPRTKLGRLAIACVVVIVGVPLAAYAFFLGLQAYSAWQASSTLDRLESLRVGSPEAEFLRAVKSCKVQHSEWGTWYELTSGAQRFESPVRLLSKLPDDWHQRVESIAWRAGLRYWDLRVSAVISEGRVVKVDTDLFLIGRYETLSARWRVSEHIEGRYPSDPIANEHLATYMYWNHITSNPSGEGYNIYVTPASEPSEWQATHINRRCLFSFRGCDGFCELLPAAARLLRERKQTFGGCTDVPRSWCEIEHDRCRGLFSDRLHSYLP